MKQLQQKSSELVDRFVGLYVDKPYHCFGGCCITLLVFTAVSVASGAMTMTLDQESAWRVHHGHFTQAMDGFDQARKASRRSARRLQGRSGTDDSPDEFILMYRNPAGGTAFTPSLLQDMCRLETALVREGSGVCPQTGGDSRGRCPMFSPVHTFYGNIFRAVNDSCPLLTQSTIDATVSTIAEDVARFGSSSRYAALLTPGFVGSNATDYTRSGFKILKGTRAETEKYLLKEVFAKVDPPLAYGFLRSAFQADDDRMVQFGGLRVRLFFRFDEFMRMLPPDFSLAICSIIFVFFTIYLHLQSFFLACFGMWQIVVSLPIAALFYRKLFMVDYFEFLHILVVYLVLGVGADDIFVLLDTWRHIKAEHGIGWGTGGVDRDALHRALRTTWSRASGAIFNTSFTTGVAFLSMSISKVMPMKTCGWFAAVAIVLNYIFTITFTPSLLMVYQLHFGGKRCCCPNPRAPAEPETAGQEGKSNSCFAGGIERFLGKVYLPMMKMKVGPVTPVPIIFVCAMAGVAIQGAYYASRLTPPSKPEQWFPSNHMWVGISSFISSTYYSPDYERYSKTWLVWGVKDMNFDSFNQYKPDDFPAQVEYDSSFDLSTAEAQQAFLGLCQQMRSLSCTLPGCRGSQGAYVLQAGSNQAFSCVLEDFQRWLSATQGVTSMPQGASFLSLLERFRSEAAPSVYADDPEGMLGINYRDLLGFDQGRLTHAAIEMRSSMLNQEPYGSGVEVRTLVDNFAKAQLASMPASMQSLKVASSQFASFDLGQELVSGLFSGMAIAGPLVFLVLLLSTRNIILAIYAVVSVASIVVSVLGFCKSAMDYDLGVGEAIAGIIVIGYSVDYVVHFAHTYTEAASEGIKTREGRATFTIENMGSTVFAGAITTAGSGVFMFFCFLSFFTKMALLICMTIFYSFLFSLCMFMGLCFLIGPEGNFGNICCCLQERSSKVIAPDDAGAHGKEATKEEVTPFEHNPTPQEELPEATAKDVNV